VHLDTIKVYHSPTNAQVIVLRKMLKCTLKQLRHVSVQSHHLQGANYPCLLKVQLLKYSIMIRQSTPEQCNITTSTRTLPIYTATSLLI